MQTRVVSFSASAIEEARALIVAGKPVAVPTETVYGLAGDATSDLAVAAIFEAKGRPAFNPLIVHVADPREAFSLGEFNPPAKELAERHWPGPLTLVVPARPGSGIVRPATADLETIALRVPAHRAMRALLMATKRPLAAPSANASGTMSPTRAAHVLRTLDGRISLIVDDGVTSGGIESTILAATGGRVRLLRPGPIIVSEAMTGAGQGIESPGQLSSHYAPSKPLRLNATCARSGETLIGFGAVEGDVTLSATGDVTEAARQLFDVMHQADAAPSGRIAVAPIPETGIGIAINDRLRRAAAGAAQ